MLLLKEVYPPLDRIVIIPLTVCFCTKFSLKSVIEGYRVFPPKGRRTQCTLFDILRYQYYDCLALCIIAALLLTFIY